MLSPSDIVVRPASLTDRPVANAQPEAPLPEPTIMAERFAPEGQKIAGNGAALPLAEPPVVPGLIPERGRGAAGIRWLLVASILVSLVPTALILALLWQGAIKLPRSSDAQIVFDHDKIMEMQQASLAAVPAMRAEPGTDAEAKADIALTAPDEIAAKTGEEVAFDIAIDSAEALPARSVIAIRDMPEGSAFSQGRPYGNGEWNLRPDEIGDLKLKLPKTANGNSQMRVELMAADGTVLASALTRLEIAPDPKAALILRSDETSRVADLIAHGQKMIDVGYFAGARAYFKRAAEAGSGDAALLLAVTYDQEFIDKIGAHGIKADPGEARIWYERAKQLGVEEADSKLKALKENWTHDAQPAQATQADTAKPAQAQAEPAGGGQEAPAKPAEEDSGPALAAAAPFPANKGEWVALVGYANLRTAPSSTADTLRVAEKGSKLRVTGRSGNWVQVTDPVTGEVAWVYSRFVETAEAPAR